MSVLIKDMEMPKSCYECKLDIRTDVCLAFSEWNKEHPYSIRATDRLPDCPLSEVPEPQWIPCSERLPEDKYVLISKKPTKLSGSKWCVTIAIRMADPRSRKVDWRDIGFNVIQDNEVLAWMPLPEPYRGEEK